MSTQTEKAYFGAGCFWGIQQSFDGLPGVHATRVGYAGGHHPHPSYQAVCTGETGHAEVVEVEYSSESITFHELLSTFWRAHDPTSLNRQGADVGTQYRSIVLFTNQQQKEQAQQQKDEFNQKKVFGRDVVTEIRPLEQFYPAEPYHQHYLKKRGL